MPVPAEVQEKVNEQSINTQEILDLNSNNNETQNNEVKGFLDDIKVKEPTPADTKIEDQVTENSLGEETVQQEKTDEQENSTEKNTVKLHNGKEVSVNELVKLYELSSAEGIRLAQKIKEIQELLNEKEKQLLELELKLDQPPFKILTDEELELLPTKEQVDYYLKLEKWQQEKEAKKAKLEQIKKMEEEEQNKLKEYIVSKVDEMSSNEEKYPHYNELIPVMETIIQEAPFLTGYKETPEIVYYLALGLKYHKILSESKSVQEKELNKQKQEITSKASSISGVGGKTANKITNSAEELFDMNYGNSIFK
jgi:hypothetical protein